MKPTFSLSLSADGIVLMQRLVGGWYVVDTVDPTSPDLAQAMADLQQKAAQATDAPLGSKLIIPQDQIKYLDIPINASSEAQRLDQIQTAVEGATPYGLNEVAYDWRMKGTKAQIAIVAHDTLAEAEGFAADFGFAPLCFVASPDPAEFTGEPFFGMASGAATHLPEGETVDRDDNPVVSLGAIPAPEPEPDILQDVNVAAATVPDREDVPQVAFSSRRKVDQTVSDAVVIDEIQLPPSPKIEPRITLTGSDSDALPKEPSLGTASREFPQAPAVVPTAFAEAPAPAPSAAPVTGRSAVTQPDTAVPAAQFVPNKDETATALVAPETTAQPKKAGAVSGYLAKRQSQKAQKQQSAAVVADEAEKFTVFGARKPAQVGGKPRFLGLILTGVLLLFLALVALFAANWDSPAVSWMFGKGAESQVAGMAPADEVAPAVIIDAVATDLGLEQPTPPQASAGLSTPIKTDVQGIYAATGIWTDPPALPQSQSAPFDELNALYVASIDPVIDISDAVALPALQLLGTDVAYNVLQAPLAASVRFALNPLGLVIATPDGAITPDGYRVFAGRPVSTPPERPEFDVVVEQPVDPRVIGVRPKLRPEGIFENRQREELGGYTRIELAALRPKLRPQGIAAPIAAPSLETEQATADALREAEQEQTETATAIGGTKLAVAASRIPKKRPNNFGRTVAKRLEQAEPKESRVVATVAPRAIKPSGPVNGTVARNATTTNAIKLNRVNLIGVFGKTSNREAMVRLKNGRMVKVKAGDRLDGGRVAAIGDGQLRYVKNGRNITLKMPQG